MGHVVVLKFQPVLQAAVCLQDRVEILLSKSQRLKVRRLDSDDEFGKGYNPGIQHGHQTLPYLKGNFSSNQKISRGPGVSTFWRWYQRSILIFHRWCHKSIHIMKTIQSFGPLLINLYVNRSYLHVVGGQFG